jgi:myo-inositol-1(or 4)-monophosphatase
VVDLPFLGLRYWAYEGGGAYRDGEPIEVAAQIRRLAAGASKNDERLRITRLLAPSVQRVRMFGSAAIDLAWMADGRLGASVMLANKPWDTAAGVVLAREAGALVLDRHGRPHTTRSTSTVAVVPSLRDALMTLLSTQTA